MSNLAYNDYGMGMRSNRDRTSPDDKVRICFYGRVSSQHEQQLNAFDNQMQWYEGLLERHPNWVLIDEYTDKGVTGTLAKKRPGFMRMIQDAEQGKFDLIVTREVCRFARNTVDSLNFTRRLRHIGVEVFFFNDGIWSMDTDGELRLTIMSALAQEESRKVSERSRAGQKVSREKCVLYGNGNIMGYTLVKGAKSVDNTYKIDEEQAETVRMIYDYYLQGYGEKKIAVLMAQHQRKDASGLVKWNPSKVGRILNNKTYAGYIGYNKSYTTDFLEHTRKKNTDRNSIVYVKGNFPPIISEEDWNKAESMRNERRNTIAGRMYGRNPSRDKWAKKLVCSCGKTFKKYKWRVNQDGQIVYGFQCRNQVDNRKKSYWIERGHDGTGYCDVNSICEWKLDFMMKQIVERIWEDPKATISDLLECIEENYTGQGTEIIDYEKPKLIRDKERLTKRLENLLEMRIDGEIDKESYNKKSQEIKTKIEEMEKLLAEKEGETVEEPVQEEIAISDIEKIRKTLKESCDMTQKELDEEFVNQFVNRVTPYEDGSFKWFLNLGGSQDEIKPQFNEMDYVPISTFTIKYDEARSYRKSMGSYLRVTQWSDLVVKVYVKA